MHIFSTCGTSTCNSLIIVCSGNLDFQLTTQEEEGIHPEVLVFINDEVDSEQDKEGGIVISELSVMLECWEGVGLVLSSDLISGSFIKFYKKLFIRKIHSYYKKKKYLKNF